MLLFAGCDSSGDAETAVDEAPLPTGESTVGEPVQKAYAVDDVFTLNYSASHVMNPLTTESVLNEQIAPLIYETLYTVDETFTAQPTRILDRAETEDNKLWYFYINTDVEFSDGTKLTAADVRYSIFRAMATSLYRSRLSTIEGISYYGDDLMTVSVKAANSQFPSLLNIPIIKDGAISEENPLGTGPYKLDGGSKLVINSRHPDAGDMPIDTIYLKEFKSAEEIITNFEDSVLDLAVNDPTGLSELGYGSANETRFNTSSMHYLGFNAESAFFSNANCRAAMNFIVNRTYVTSNLMGGCGAAATLPVSPVSPFYNTTFAQGYEYSPEKCGTMLTNANVKDHDDDGKLEYMLTGIPMEIDIKFIVNNESAVKVSAARRIAEDMRSLGLTVDLRELSWSEYVRALNNGEFDMYYAEVILTPDFDLTSLLTENGSLNYGNFRDSTCADVISQYLSAGDNFRVGACDLMCQYIISNAPIVTIAFEKRVLVTHTGVVTGAKPTQYDVFNKLTEWTITP